MIKLTLVFAAAWLLITLVIFLRARRLEDKPRKGTILDRLEGSIRLRDLFRLAVSIEDEGSLFYRQLAERSGDPAAKALCSRLAGEEGVHMALFKKQLDNWRDLPLHHTLWQALLEDVKQKGILRSPPDPDASEDEMAAYAIGQESKTAEFYQAFETAFPQAWKRAAMSALVQEERRHEHELRAAYPHLNPKR